MTEATISPMTLEYPQRCAAEHAFATFGDWRVLLDRFAALADSTT